MELQFPRKLGFLFNPAPYKIAWGGRMGVKSWSFATALLELGARDKLRILCARETMRSIADSVHKLLSDQIIRLGLEQRYTVQQTTILGTNGTEFIFAGLKHNIDNIKSLEGADIVWVEEAQTVSKESWDKLIPTIRRKAGAEIWVSFNPELETDDTYVRFIQKTPAGAIVQKTGWEDNRWLPEDAKAEIEYMRENQPDDYEHIYGGRPRSSVVGAIYEQEIRRCEEAGRICRVPYDATKPVDVFWDLGYGDMVSIWFAQSIAFEYRVIDYYEHSRQALDHYLQVLQSKGYTYGTCVFPWDGGAKSLGTGRSIEELTRAKGFRTRVLPQWGVLDGINAVRTIFHQCYFDSERCSTGLQHLRRYQWGPPTATGQHRRQPLHDDASHAADAFRTLAVYIKPPEKPKPAIPQTVRQPSQGYAPFG